MKKLSIFIAILVLLLFTSSCIYNPILPADKHATPTKTAETPKNTPTNTLTPTETPVPTPTNTPTETPVPTPNLEEKLKKIEELEKKEAKKKFMLSIALDDYLCYKRGGKSKCEDMWKRLPWYIDDTESLISSLKSDFDIYLAFEDSTYALIWAYVDLSWELYNYEMPDDGSEEYNEFVSLKEKMDKVLEEMSEYI